MERFIVWSLVTMNWLNLSSRPANAQALPALNGRVS
jgi:hypothetical protein